MKDIPKKIILIWIQGIEFVPEYIIKKWKDLNAGFEIVFFDNNEIIKFLNNNYSKCILDFYKNLKFHRYKCDFFRYCYLYLNGGYYFDIDTEPINSIETVIDDIKSNTILITTLSGEFEGHISQGILISEKKNPIIEKCIDTMIHFGCNIGIDPKDEYPYFGHPTKCMYDIILKYTNNNTLKEGNIKYHESNILLGTELYDKDNRIFTRINNKKFGYSRYSNYTREYGFIIT